MTDIPERLQSALSDRYALERELGQGGMATVYLAQDLKHDRRVAIKVLKPELAAVIGGERFVSEIKTTAGLQHPHILPLFDSGESDSFLFYVMPYIEGETLRDRLDKERQLGVDDALGITRDVADALDYAHRQGVIHRDIKPENILLHDGRPVVADFGIAVAISAAGGGRMTETGLSLGTPHYMSPEQATADRDLSARSDVYSLACVLYEMLAGDPPHTGPTAQAILMRILTETPRPVSDTRTSVPPNVVAALSKGLEKLPADRFASAAEFKDALDRTDFTHTSAYRPSATAAAAAPAAGAPAPVRGAAAPLNRATIAAFAGILLFALWGWLRPSNPDETSVFSLDMTGLVVSAFDNVEISPDGRVFAVRATPADSSTDARIHVRRADEDRFRPLTETPESSDPTFSPDSRWIAFRSGTRADAAIRRVSVDGGQPTTIFQREGMSPAELTWGADGFIYFFESSSSGIYRVSDSGGEPELLLADAGWAYEPTPLPGGKGVLVADSRGAPSSLGVIDLAADSFRVLIPEAAGGWYLDTGHLVYGHPNGGLQAVPFDLGRLEATGSPVPIRDGISVGGSVPYFSVSSSGDLVYIENRVRGGFGEVSVLVERDLLTGAETEIRLDPRAYNGVRYSPDGGRIAFSAAPGFGEDFHVYVYDLETGRLPRPRTVEGTNVRPAWSPAGDWIVFTRRTPAVQRLWTVAVDAEEVPVELNPALDPGVNDLHASWASDTMLLATRMTTSTTPDLWTVPVDAPTDARVYRDSEFRLFYPEISPDATRVAYQSDEFGDGVEILVQSFPTPGGLTQVSRGGGFYPRWHPEGTGIFYVRGGGFSPEQATLLQSHISTQPVFAVDSATTVLEMVGFSGEWDIHPDGDRVIYTRAAATEAQDEERESPPERYIVVLNWLEEVKARLGG